MLTVIVVGAAAYSARGLLPAAHANRCSSLRMEEEQLKCDVRKLPRSAIALDIKVPAKVTNEIHLKTLAKLAKNAKVPGFRDGKVPPQAVIAKLGMQKVKEATVEQIVDAGMTASGVGQKIQTVGEARLPEDMENVAARYTVGEPLDFTVEVDVVPSLQVQEDTYKGLSVEVQKIPFNQDAYDTALLKLRKQNADTVDAGEGVGAEEGEEVLVNMNGFMATAEGGKGEPLPAVAGGEGVTVPLETGKFMPGLVEGLIGVKAGEMRDISVVFPPRSSAPQLAGKAAVFEVECLTVQRKVLPPVGDDFANRVRDGMTFEELDAKLREGVNQDAEDKLQAATHQALEKALVDALPEDFEVPDTLVEDVTKERFAQMLSEMRERGTSDDQLKELITQENYERYKKISRPLCEGFIKGNFAIKTVGAQQGLSVPRNEVDDEVMTLQAQAVQQGQKFKESETRPRVEASLEKRMVLNWLQTHATVNLVDEKEFDASDVLGQTPEELAARMREEELSNKDPQASVETTTTKPEPADKATPGEPAADAKGAPAPDGFEWGDSF